MLAAAGQRAERVSLPAPAGLSEREVEVLVLLARGLTNKFLHAPSMALNQAGSAERAEMLALYQRIYNFPDPE